VVPRTAGLCHPHIRIHLAYAERGRVFREKGNGKQGGDRRGEASKAATIPVTTSHLAPRAIVVV